MGTQMSLFDRLGGAPAITAAAGRTGRYARVCVANHQVGSVIVNGEVHIARPIDHTLGRQ
jgi:hypothetical protein